jgi:hypothetical protein
MSSCLISCSELGLTTLLILVRHHVDHDCRLLSRLAPRDMVGYRIDVCILTGTSDFEARFGYL